MYMLIKNVYKIKKKNKYFFIVKINEIDLK